MILIELLEKNESEIIEKAVQALDRSQLKHYTGSSREENRGRLKQLYSFVKESINEFNLIPLTDYIQEVARERFTTGFAFSEVNTAINVLEEVIWEQIKVKVRPMQLPEALGMLSRVLGAGKTALANTYVSLASKGKITSIDVSALFMGTDGV
jgi:hypothetical protein